MSCTDWKRNTLWRSAGRCGRRPRRCDRRPKAAWPSPGGQGGRCGSGCGGRAAGGSWVRPLDDGVGCCPCRREQGQCASSLAEQDSPCCRCDRVPRPSDPGAPGPRHRAGCLRCTFLFRRPKARGPIAWNGTRAFTRGISPEPRAVAAQAWLPLRFAADQQCASGGWSGVRIPPRECPSPWEGYGREPGALAVALRFRSYQNRPTGPRPPKGIRPAAGLAGSVLWGI